MSPRHRKGNMTGAVPKAATAIALAAAIACVVLSVTAGVSLPLALFVAAAATLALAAAVTLPRDYTAAGQLIPPGRMRIDPWSEEHRENMFAARLLVAASVELLVLATLVSAAALLF